MIFLQAHERFVFRNSTVSGLTGSWALHQLLVLDRLGSVSVWFVLRQLLVFDRLDAVTISS